MRKKVAIFFEKSCKNIWWFEKNALYLHSQTKSNGSVAQLNRVLDYGSSGSRFESWRSHQGGNRKVTAAFFYVQHLVLSRAGISIVCE